MHRLRNATRLKLKTELSRDNGVRSRACHDHSTMSSSTTQEFVCTQRFIILFARSGCAAVFVGPPSA